MFIVVNVRLSVSTTAVMSQLRNPLILATIGLYATASLFGFMTAIATGETVVSRLFSNGLAIMTGITLYATVLDTLTPYRGI